jgi:hypothetical protein
MPKVTHDICVIVRKYTDNQGKSKNQYRNVGRIMQMDDGSHMRLLNRDFSPAGVMNPEGRDSVVLYEFPVKENNAGQPVHQSPPPAQVQRNADGLVDDVEIPF